MQCAVCHQPATDSCAVCKSVSYCSKSHQTSDWKNHKKVCLPFLTQEFEGMGMGLVATRNFEAGFTLLEEVSTIQAPGLKSFLNDGECYATCATCGDSKLFMKACSTCFWPICSALCEMHPVHKENECKEFASRELKFPPPTSWSSGMFIMCMRANSLKSRDPDSFNQLMALQDFHSIPEANQHLQETQDLPPGTFEVLSGPNSLNREEFKKLLRISKANDFQSKEFATNALLRSKVYNVDIFLKASRLNHSCIPNCMFDLDQGPLGKLRVFTIAAVSKGKQFTIPLFEWNGFQPTVERQKIISKSAGFICKCRRCVDSTELGTFLSGIKCFNCSSHLKADSDSDAHRIGFLLPADPLHDPEDPDPEFECHRCRFKSPFGTILTKLPDAVQHAFANIKEWIQADCGNKSSLRGLLYKYDEGRDFKDHLHRNHWLILNTMRLVVQNQGYNNSTHLGYMMTKHDLRRHLQRLEILLEMDEKLFRGFPKYRYGYLEMWERATFLILDLFGDTMSRDEYAKLKSDAAEKRAELWELEQSPMYQ